MWNLRLLQIKRVVFRKKGVGTEMYSTPINENNEKEI